jgi:hypothetical protein
MPGQGTTGHTRIMTAQSSINDALTVFGNLAFTWIGQGSINF